MVTLAALWLPILVATVLVFVASNIVWMVLPHHKSDTVPLPDEPAALEALGKQSLRPGVYRFPFASDMKQMGAPEFVAKLEKGPVGLLTILPNGTFDMARSLGLWTAYILVMGIFVAYLTGRVCGPGAPYLEVFRVAGTAAFLGYSGSHLPDAIWWGKPLRNVLMETLDGLVYALLTAGAFGWLWPR